MKKLFPVVLLTSFIISCEEDANVDVPVVDPVLVLNCFLTPQDSFIRVQVSKSDPVFGPVNNTDNVVSNATVTLYGNNTSVQLPYNSTYEWYEVPTTLFQVVAGNEYHLVVSEPGGLQADAYTTVPLSAPSFSCTATTTIYPNGYDREARFSISISDEAGINNYYRFAPYKMVYSNWSMDSTLDYDYWNWSLFNDEGEDGGTMSESASIYYYNSSDDTVLAYYTYLFNCNYDYYRFHQSIYNYTGDDPFSEPVLVYSNVTNGLGIFAAANPAIIRVPR